MHRRPFSAQRSSRGPNSKEWTGALIGGDGFTAAGGITVGGWIVDPVTMIDDYESPTIIRTRVALGVYKSTATGGTSGTSFAFGIYVCTGDPDSAAIPADLWDPALDQEADWVYRFVVSSATGTPATSFFNGAADTLIDSLAKRKVPRGAGIMAVAQAAPPGVGTDTYAYSGDVRCLIISG